MGFLQSNVGYRRCDGETRLKRYGKAVTFINLAQAEAALSVAEDLVVSLTLISVRGAAASAGPGWFDAVVAQAPSRFPAVRCEAILDCDDAPGDALAALRHGVKHIRYCGAKQDAIADIAEQYGARVSPARPESLDLANVEGQDAIAACRSWLSD